MNSMKQGGQPVDVAEATGLFRAAGVAGCFRQCDTALLPESIGG